MFPKFEREIFILLKSHPGLNLVHFCEDILFFHKLPIDSPPNKNSIIAENACQGQNISR